MSVPGIFHRCIAPGDEIVESLCNRIDHAWSGCLDQADTIAVRF